LSRFVFGEPLSVGIVAGVRVGLDSGGHAFIQHCVLRLLLARNGSAPWNYPAFLDTAAEYLFLRKVGGGYIFVHRMLMDYFAALPDAGEQQRSGGGDGGKGIRE
jgi:eukaryotic-like serine/threonine-protein kinase